MDLIMRFYTLRMGLKDLSMVKEGRKAPLDIVEYSQ
jgi:hypothetical protein